jgi:hypothetical protein
MLTSSVSVYIITARGHICEGGHFSDTKVREIAYVLKGKARPWY